MRQANEPSVEDILASIKKVIARDNRAESARRDAGPNDVLDLGALGAAVAGGEPTPGLVNDDQDSPLLSAASTAAMHDTLAALAVLSAPGAQPQIVRSGETSLEGMVRDLLRPMLAQWLDTHLPPMVERLVAAEITRIVRKQS